MAMIFKRAVARLRAQDWAAIVIELAIVIVGVFVGIWVANWNQERSERDETKQLLRQLRPELSDLERFSQSARAYYATTDKFAAEAFRGWRHDPGVSDRDFVVAAYQASQIYGYGNNGASWALVFGGDELREIEDQSIREPLTRLMTFEYDRLNYETVASRYRDEVRRVIPDAVQQTIRQRCGDRINRDGETFVLPPTCSVAISPADASAIAAELRTRKQLVGDLALHRSAVATYVTNLDLFDRQWRALAKGVSKLEE